jgi:hypothetical protein
MFCPNPLSFFGSVPRGLWLLALAYSGPLDPNSKKRNVVVLSFCEIFYLPFFGEVPPCRTPNYVFALDLVQGIQA